MDERPGDDLREHLRELISIDAPPDLAARAVRRAVTAERNRGKPIASLALVLGAAAMAVAIIWGQSSHLPSPGTAASPDPGGVAASVPATTASPYAEQTSSPAALLSPTPAAASPTTAVASPTLAEPSPTEVLSDLERSDRFWRGVTDYGPYNYEYSSLDEMALEAHLIVRGQVVGFASGVTHPYAGDWPPYGTIIGLVEVVEILKGKPNTREVGIIEVQNLGWSGITDADLPGDEVILFLMNDAEVRREYGVGLSDPENQPFRYWRPNPYQSALRIINGDFRFLRPGRSYRAYRNLFPAGLDERAVESVINDIREVVEAQGADD
jgi:hypothetical protein